MRERYRELTPALTDTYNKPLPPPTPPTRVVRVMVAELHQHAIITQSPQFTLGFTTLGVLHAMALHKGYNVTYPSLSYHTKVVSPPLNALVPPIHPTLHTTPGKPNLCTVCTALPFPECHMVGILQYEAFQTGFFHLVICVKIASCLPMA